MALGLLERERELDVITGLVDGCRGGGGAVLLIEGAAGIGKTALIGEACRLARGKGLRVLLVEDNEDDVFLLRRSLKGNSKPSAHLLMDLQHRNVLRICKKQSRSRPAHWRRQTR